MRTRRDRATRAVLAAAVLLLLAGLATGGTGAWTWWGRTRQVHGAQHRLSRDLDARWAAGAGGLPLPDGPAPLAPPRAAPLPFGDARGVAGSGTPLARLHLPTLGLDLVVVDGAAEADLRLGPGYIPGTAPIGAAGNTGIAGQRYPGVFWSLDALTIGAPVVVETRDAWLVYRVIEADVMAPGDNTLLGPPPPGAGPLLTLVTTEPRLSSARRLVRQATLIRRDPRAGPRPAELT